MNNPVIDIHQLEKSFTLHHQGKTSYQVFHQLNLQVYKGQCIVLLGESGLGKSTLLKCLYASYITDSGSIRLTSNDQCIDFTQLNDRQRQRVRRERIAYVSQFLRVIPRIPTIEVVIEPMLELGINKHKAEKRAKELLHRLNVPEHLWHLSPTTFSGGEQQRVNIAREFSVLRPIMLLDEPTASLDEVNKSVVIEMIKEAKSSQCAIVGIFHDKDSRQQVADKLFDLKTGCLHE